MSVAQAKVWNDHSKDYEEKFRDEMVKIPAKHYVIMEKPDADQFLGQYTPIKRDGQGKDLAPKMLRIEVIEGTSGLALKAHICMACSRQHATEKELQQHIEANHLEQLTDSDAKEELKKRAK
jgi:hypothetical protein